jgi:hypothetical protein
MNLRLLCEDKSEVETDANLVTKEYEYTSQNEDGHNINEQNETDTSSYDEIIEPSEDREFIIFDNEGVPSQLFEHHAEKEEIEFEKESEMNQHNFEKSNSSEFETSLDDNFDDKDLTSNLEKKSTFEDLPI